MSSQISWGAVIFDVIILLGAFALVLQTGNPKYLWLLVIVFFSGGYKL